MFINWNQIYKIGISDRWNWCIDCTNNDAVTLLYDVVNILEYTDRDHSKLVYKIKQNLRVIKNQEEIKWKMMKCCILFAVSLSVFLCPIT